MNSAESEGGSIKSFKLVRKALRELGLVIYSCAAVAYSTVVGPGKVLLKLLRRPGIGMTGRPSSKAKRETVLFTGGILTG